MLPAFTPAFGLRTAFVQSVVGSKRPVHWLWRRRGLDLNALSTLHHFAVRDEQEHPVTLTGWHTPQAGAKSLVVLIHGWEGGQDSSYLYGLACSLYRAGHAVLRLCLRDHGSTHHGLNERMFHSARLREVAETVAAAQALEPGLPLFVVGFSLGGNFALRLGMRGAPYGVQPRLCIGISPAINPRSTLIGINQGPKLLHRYFLDKWRKTTTAKAAAFPGRYDFSRHLAIQDFTEITRAFVEDHTQFETLDHYLAQYTLTPAMLMASPQPLAILTSRDDSVCPPADFEGLRAEGGMVAYVATDHGGHCGFIENWQMDSWAESRVVELLANQLAAQPRYGHQIGSGAGQR